jgi:hypothetical protein
MIKIGCELVLQSSNIYLFDLSLLGLNIQLL